MRFVRVQYDAYNRQFKLQDQNMARDLEDGAAYMIADFSTDDFMPTEQLDLLEANHFPA